MKEMEKTREIIEKEIVDTKQRLAGLEKERQNLNGKILVKWNGECNKNQHGKPYFAVLTKGENGKKYTYQFLPTVDAYSGRYVQSTFQGELPIGTVLRGRYGSSWKKDYTDFYRVEEKGLKVIKESEVLTLLGILN